MFEKIPEPYSILILNIVRSVRIFNPFVIYYYIFSRLFGIENYCNHIGIKNIRNTINKDTIFIFGSGYSINNITKDEFLKMKIIGDTLSFNYFFRGQFLPIDYHLCGEIEKNKNYGGVLSRKRSLNNIKKYYDELFSNDFYNKTTFFLRYKIDYSLVPSATRAIFALKVFNKKRVCLYGIKRNRSLGSNIESISHIGGTLSDAINIAYLLGYKKIVLVGIDLYDRRYFWLGYNEVRSIGRVESCSEQHATAQPLLDLIGEWNTELLANGVNLTVYNPKSLLTEVLPVFSFNQE